jgi:3-hydroxymyristoyl/3-hydroxydecanoyl-(acyl carrier protein) dehydratase
MKTTTQLEFLTPSHSTDGLTETVSIRARVAPDLVWFEGHFDDRPVLPAVILLQELLRAIALSWPDLPPLRRVIKTKFRRPIGPSARLVLRLSRESSGPRVGFEVEMDGTTIANGLLQFEAYGETPE